MKKKNIRLASLVLALLLMVSMFAPSAHAANYTVSVKTGQYVTLRNEGAAKYLNVYGSQNRSGANLDIYAWDGTSGQHFLFVYVGNGRYVIQPKCAPGCAVNIYGYSAGNKVDVCVWTKSGHVTQQWIIEYNPTLKGYIIRSADNPTYVLTATGSRNSSNVRLEKYSSSNKYQVWTSSAFSVTTSTTSSDAQNKTLNINESHIRTVGRQSVSGPCFCFALAYARTIIDGRVHYWYEYDVYGGGRGQSGAYANRSLANFNSKFETNKQTAFRDIYNRVKNGEPVVINVNGGRSTGEHFVTVVGYTGVVDPNNLSEANFLIIDSAGPSYSAPENLGSIGYKLKNNSGQGYYYCFKK